MRNLIASLSPRNIAVLAPAGLLVLGGVTAAFAGRDAVQRLYEAYFRAFPDLKLRQEALLIDGHRAVILGRISGTDTGGFMGMAPSGRIVTAPVALFYELRDGLIVRERRIYDFTGVLVQVGLLKAKPI